MRERKELRVEFGEIKMFIIRKIGFVINERKNFVYIMFVNYIRF